MEKDKSEYTLIFVSHKSSSIFNLIAGKNELILLHTKDAFYTCRYYHISTILSLFSFSEVVIKKTHKDWYKSIPIYLRVLNSYKLNDLLLIILIAQFQISVYSIYLYP